MRRAALAFPHAAQRDVRLERRTLGRETDRLAGALESILEHIEDGCPFEADPEHPGPALAGKGAEIAQLERQRTDVLPRDLQRLLDHFEPLGRDLAEELEREVKSLILHPPHRPFAGPEAGQHPEYLGPRRLRHRQGGEEPHYNAGAPGAIASSPPRRYPAGSSSTMAKPSPLEKVTTAVHCSCTRANCSGETSSRAFSP